MDAVRLFGAARYQGDECWDLFTKLTLCNLPSLVDPHLLLDLVRGFASAKRGSDALWELFAKKLLKTTHPNEAAKTAAALRMLLEVEVEPKDGAYFGFSLSALLQLVQPGLVGAVDEKYSSHACEDLFTVALTYPGISDEDSKTLQAAVLSSGTAISRAHQKSIERMVEASVAKRGGRSDHLLAGGWPEAAGR